MFRVTASNFRNKIGALQDKALAEPVTITKHGEDRLVLMSFREYERLKKPKEK